MQTRNTYTAAKPALREANPAIDKPPEAKAAVEKQKQEALPAWVRHKVAAARFHGVLWGVLIGAMGLLIVTSIQAEVNFRQAAQAVSDGMMTREAIEKMKGEH